MKNIIRYIIRDGLATFTKKIIFKSLVISRINKLLSMRRYRSSILLKNTDLTYQLFANKKYKDFEYSIYKKYIAANDICIDVGANIGLMTLMYSSLAPQGVVHAFEPSPQMYTILEKNVRKNGFVNCQLYQCALGSIATQVLLDETALDDTTYKVGGAAGISVSQRRLDDIFENTPVINFMKIDVEGYEIDVLRGGVETLKKTKLLFIEFISSNQKIATHSPKELLDILSLYFEIYTISETCEEIPFVYQEEVVYQTDLLCRLK